MSSRKEDGTAETTATRFPSPKPSIGAAATTTLPEPSADETEPAAARRAFAATFDALAARVDALLALPLDTLDAASLRGATLSSRQVEYLAPALAVALGIHVLD